jgi:hypothetical protein
MLKGAPQGQRSRARIEKLQRLLSFAQMGELVIESFLASRRADFSEFGDLLGLARPAAAAAGQKGRKA